MKTTAPGSLSKLTDKALLDRLNGIVGYGRRVAVRTLDYLNEVESRRIHLRQSFSSMFAFCRKRLRFSEGEAVRKIAAARLMKRFPEMRVLLESGTVHMSALLVMEDEFTADNVTGLLQQLVGKTKRQAEHLLAEMHPERAPAPPSIANQLRKLPSVALMPSPSASPAPLLELAATTPSSIVDTSPAAVSTAGMTPQSPVPAQRVPAQPAFPDTSSTPRAPAQPALPDTSSAPRARAQPALPDTSSAPRALGQSALPATSSAPPVQAASSVPPAGTATSPREHYLVGFHASKELRDKLERLRTLMAHENPSGDLAKIVERAADLLIAKIEKERLGQTDQTPTGPRKSNTDASRAPSRPSKDPTHVSNATKRIVLDRDGRRCTFVGENGERCTEGRFLQFDHIVPRALGGTGDPSNIRIRCAAHNRYAAEQVFGKEMIAAQIHRRQRRKSERSHATEKHLSQPPPSETNAPPS